jgi:hypothetical protein
MSVKMGYGAKPLSTIFHLYRGGQFLLVEETGVSGKNQRPAVSH